MGHARASNSTMAVAPSAGIKNVASPIPYLFGGLALMLALVGVALLILACSYSKNSSSTSDGNEEKQTKTMGIEVDSEPKIVVIMAGDSNPTYLAKPVPSTYHTEEAD
ncbi:GLUTAMINE DUMPER 4 [Spatholobus suberectus]|nr:GLUTAMINE DUMPER 4 [Spatholobus suberectus]